MKKIIVFSLAALVGFSWVVVSPVKVSAQTKINPYYGAAEVNTFTAPNGSEIVEAGSKLSIRWNQQYDGSWERTPTTWLSHISVLYVDVTTDFAWPAPVTIFDQKISKDFVIGSGQMGFDWTIPSTLKPGPYKIITRTYRSDFANPIDLNVSNAFSVVPAGSIPTPVSTKFSIGDSVKVTESGVYVRETAGGNSYPGSRYAGDLGKIIGGPERAVVNGCDCWWWKVDYNYWKDGWTAEKFLEKVPTNVKFVAGERVKNFMNNRSIYSGYDLGTASVLPSKLPLNALGTVVGGPMPYRDDTMWQFSFDAGYTGWTSEMFIEHSAQPPSSLVIDAPTDLVANKESYLTISAQGEGTLTYTVRWGDGSANSTYTALAGQNVNARHTYTSIGTYTVSVTVRDSNGKSLSGTQVVSVVKPNAGGSFDRFLFTVPGGGENCQTGQQYAIRWGDWDAIGVSGVRLILINKATGLAQSTIVENLSKTQLLSGSYNWTIPNGVADGLYFIKAIVYKTDGKWTDVFSASFSIAGGGGANPGSPTISDVSGPTALQVGQMGAWTVAATDPNGDALTYEAAWGDNTTTPAGSALSLTHTFGATGVFTIVFKVNDPGGLTAQFSKTVAVTLTATTSTPPITGVGLSIGARVRNTTLAGLTPSWAGVGFTGFTKDKGVIIGGPLSGTWQVHYDYGGDAWPSEGNLQSIGIPTGKWDFTADNILGREINIGDGVLVIDPYYVSVNYQVSIPSSVAQNSLPTAGVAAQAGSGGRWNCLNTYAVNPSVYGNNFWGDTVCRYEKGNQPPKIDSFTGDRDGNVFVGVSQVWRFTASDPEGALASYAVDWGDNSNPDSGSLSGATASKDVNHTYAQAGTFTIILTVTDGAGLKATATKQVTVTAPCSTRFQSGDGVKVINTDAEHPLNVRSSPERLSSNPDANKLGGHYDNDQGVVNGGPVSASGYCWWQVNFDQAPSGWVAEGGGAPIQYWLEKVGGSREGDVNVESSGADRLVPGGTLTIRWSMPTTISSVHIYLSNYGIIKLNAPNTGSYIWNIPADLPPRDDYVVIIYSAEPGISMQQTSQQFSISASGNNGENNTGSGDHQNPQNQPPVLANPSGAASVTINTSATWQVSATDSDSTVLSYSVNWGDGSATSTYTGTSGQVISMPHTYTSTGQKTIGVTVSDGQGSDSGSLNVNVTSGATGGNGAPIITTFTGPVSLLAGVSASWNILASDPEGMSLSYTIIWGDGNTETFSGASGIPVAKMHSYSTTGYKTVQLTVADAAGNSVSAIPIRVNITSNTTIILPPAKFVIGDPVRVTGDYLQVRTAGSLAGLAQGSRMTGDLGTIVGGPKYSDGYVWWNVNYDTGVDGWSVQDWLEKAGSTPVANRLPVIDSFAGPTTLAPSVNGSWDIKATDPDGDAMTYRIDWGGDTYFWQDNLNPGPQYAGKLVSGNSIQLKYYFRSAGTYNLTLTVTDSKGGSASKTASVTVANTSNYVPLGGYAPLWNAPDLPPLNNPDRLTTWTGPDGRKWIWVASSGLWKLTFIP